LSLTPKGLKNPNWPFSYESGYFQKKYATNCLCECCQRQRCKTFIGLSNPAQMGDEDVPFYLQLWAKLTHPLKNADLQSIFASSILPVIFSEKGSIVTNRKSTTRFPVSLRRTAHVASIADQGVGLKNTKWPLYNKTAFFSLRKSPTNFPCIKIFRVNVVRHSLAHLTDGWWVLLYLKFWDKVIHHLQKMANLNRHSLVQCLNHNT